MPLVSLQTNIIPHFSGHMITYAWRDQSYSLLVSDAPVDIPFINNPRRDDHLRKRRYIFLFSTVNHHRSLRSTRKGKTKTSPFHIVDMMNVSAAMALVQFSGNRYTGLSTRMVNSFAIWHHKVWRLSLKYMITRTYKYMVCMIIILSITGNWENPPQLLNYSMSLTTKSGL